MYRCGRAANDPLTGAALPTPFSVGTGYAKNFSVKIWGSNITVEGDGPASVILIDEVHSIPLLFEFPAQSDTGNILIRNLRFVGETTATLGVTKVWSEGVASAGVLIALAGQPGFLARNITIRDCVFDDANKTAAILPRYLENLHIEGCSFTNFKDYVQVFGVRFATKLGETINISTGG